MISLRKVSKSYAQGKVHAVRSIDLDVRDGEFLVIVGESGSGKTTTLKMINRLIEPTSGQILVGGRDVQSLAPVELRRGIGYVFQGIGLFPHMSVGANVAVVPRLLGWSTEEIQVRVDELLEMVGLPAEQYRSRMPQELSGGQQQRVGFARALAARPKLILMDEPFGALDPVTRDSLQRELKHLHESLNLTLVMVSHDITESLLVADRIAVMKQGCLEQVGKPHQLLTQPKTEYVAVLTESPRRRAAEIEALLEKAESENTEASQGNSEGD